MRICLLTDQDPGADPFPEDDWPCDPRPFLPDAEWTVLELWKEYAVQQVIDAAREGFDLFFNLCDGAWDEGRVGIEVIQALEWLEVPFTGADSTFFEPSREAMKRVCAAWEIDTPAYRIARTGDEVERAAEVLSFPLFVKHPSSYASNGLTRASRVADPAALLEQAGIMLDRFGAVLIEEFIEGTECTVLVGENPDDPGSPTVYQPIQYRFPEGESFKHYDLKWVEFDALHASPVTDPELDARLREVSARFFLGMRGVGFGRCDVRVTEDGRPFMLEINANCGIYYADDAAGGADLALMHDPAGRESFTRQLVAAALRRHERRQKGWSVLPTRPGEYGVFTTRPAIAGDLLIPFEGRPHHLVTRSRVEAGWSDRECGWFHRYAWPLTDEVWVAWSDDPEDWIPVNHSCDPTAWLDGLDVVARRDLASGDEITLEYATFHAGGMTPFRCACGSGKCRGIIRGSDHLEDFVDAFGPHVSDYVRSRRAERRAVAGAEGSGGRSP